MEIPLPQPENQQDIYSFGFNKSLNRDLASQQSATVYDTIQNALNAGSILSGGNLNLKSLTIGGLIKQVAPGDDIQAAIDAVSREGGGTVQLLAETYSLISDIELKSNVALVGAGRDVTILDFNDADFAIRITGAESSILKNIVISNLTIQNSNLTGLEIIYADFFRLENIKVTSCDIRGIRIQNSADFILINILSSFNTDAGINIRSNGLRTVQRYSLLNCYSANNGTNGYEIFASSNDMFYGTFVGCRSSSNTADGFDFSASGTSALDVSLLNCIANANSGIGFDVDANCQRVRFFNCIADVNTGDGFESDAIGTGIYGCYSSTAYDINSSVNFIGNDAAGGGAVDPKTRIDLAESEQFQSAYNLNENTRTARRYMIMQNNSGAGLRQGNVVVFASVAGGDNITTTSTAGDTKVFGIADETIANAAWGRILIEGYTTNLYAANVDSSIAIGDYLSTYSAAYYVKKASAGQIAFAIALEAPTTGTAIIDALLITPRQI